MKKSKSAGNFSIRVRSIRIGFLITIPIMLKNFQAGFDAKTCLWQIKPGYLSIVSRWRHGRPPPHRGSPRGAWPNTGIVVEFTVGVKGSRSLRLPLPLGERGVTLIISTKGNRNDFSGLKKMAL